MKTKNPIIFKQLIIKIYRTSLVLLVLFGFQCCVNKQESIVLKHSSGNDEIDQIRKDVRTHPSDASNYEYRGNMLRLWNLSLQQQGAITAGRFTPVSIRTDVTAIKDKKLKD